MSRERASGVFIAFVSVFMSLPACADLYRAAAAVVNRFLEAARAGVPEARFIVGSQMTRAMALAAKGDFEGAIRAQNQSIKAARKLDRDTGSQKARLRSYGKNQIPVGEWIAF